MLGLTPGRIFLAVEPVDMRGSFDALVGQVRRLGLDPVDGAFFVFTNSRRHLLAILHFDGSGWCLLRKRLCRGTFQLPDVAAGTSRAAVDATTLAAIFAGIDLRAPRRRWVRRPAPAGP